MFVASLVSKFESFFLQQCSAALVQAPRKWLGHQTGGLMAQHSRRREARCFRAIGQGVAGVWILESRARQGRKWACVGSGNNR